MRKLSLHVELYCGEGKPWMKMPYKKIYLESFDSANNKIDEFIKVIDYQAGVEKIIIKMLKFVDVIKILNTFQNITTLIAFQLTDLDKNDNTKIDLPNLTCLEIDTDAT